MIKKTIVFSATILTLAGCSAKNNEESSSVSEKENQSITIEDVNTAQQQWADGIVAIGTASLESNEQATEQTKEVLNSLYAFDKGPVLFKPTKAAEVPFRSTKETALSYFVGGDIDEDEGFALEPWTNVRFENYDTILSGNTAVSSGVYFFTSGDSNEEVKVEYTFGYIQDNEGNLRINLHHSSLPYS